MRRNITRRSDIFLVMLSLNLKSFIFPNLQHKKRSLALRPKAFIGYFLFLIILIYLSYQITTAMPTVLGYAEDIKVPDLLVATNKMRQDRGLAPLKLNATLSRAAKAKADDMFAKDYWAHTSPDGKEPWDFILASGYDYLYAGENLAVDFNKSNSVVDAWYDSPSHRTNLLNDKYSEIGFAVVDGELEGRKTTLVVQMFGYPRANPPAVSSASSSTDALGVATEDPLDTVTVNNEETVQIADNPIDVVSIGLNETDIPTGIDSRGRVLNSAAVFSVSRYLAIILGLFVTVLFAVDGYYIKKMGVFRISGHTILHILMLVVALIAIWYTQIGLVL